VILITEDNYSNEKRSVLFSVDFGSLLEIYPKTHLQMYQFLISWNTDIFTQAVFT